MLWKSGYYSDGIGGHFVGAVGHMAGTAAVRTGLNRTVRHRDAGGRTFSHLEEVCRKPHRPAIVADDRKRRAHVIDATAAPSCGEGAAPACGWSHLRCSQRFVLSHQRGAGTASAPGSCSRRPLPWRLSDLSRRNGLGSTPHSSRHWQQLPPPEAPASLPDPDSRA